MNQVQSLISIADDLTGQFQTIVGRMAKAAASGDDSDLSSMRAESERLYTAIWEHLDDAAKQTHAAGRSTDAYVGIRAGVGVGPGVAAVESKVVGIEHGVRHDVVTTRGTVQYNTEGVSRARQAITLLQGAWPEVDWTPATAQPEVDLRPRGLLSRLFGRR